MGTATEHRLSLITLHHTPLQPYTQFTPPTHPGTECNKNIIIIIIIVFLYSAGIRHK